MKTKLLYIQLISLLILVVSGRLYAQDLIEDVGGTLTVEIENQNAGSGSTETSDKVIDNDASTKFLLYSFSSVWMQYEFTSAVTVERYALTSANDAEARDPKDWTFSGSNNGSTWTTLDTREDVAFSARYETQYFSISSPQSFKYYRISVSANNGGSLFQLAEWRMYNNLSTPEAPSDFSAAATAGSEIYLTWTDNSDGVLGGEDGFIIERSEDGASFDEIATVAVNSSSYFDTGLEPNTTYYYRIKAFNTSESAYSGITSATTYNYDGLFADITDNGGSLYVARNSSSGEDASNLIDNDYSTKFYVGTEDGEDSFVPIWLEYTSTFYEASLVTRYTITSANDASSRDPRSWELKASEDSSTWVTIDTRSEVSFEERSSTQTFLVNNAVIGDYKYYVLEISQNNGDASIQFSELEIFVIPTEAPTSASNLSVTESTYNSVSLAWTDQSTTETGFMIERSEDGESYEAVGETGANVESYTDNSVNSYTQYYYRVQSINGDSKANYSNVVDVETPIDPYRPLAPENVQAIAISESEINLTWDDVTTIENGFEISRSTDGETFDVIDSVGTDVVTYADAGLIKGTTYYYEIIAYNDLGQSQLPSNVASATTFGKNNAPSFDEIADDVACNIETEYTISIKGISAGADEAYQTYRFTVDAELPDGVTLPDGVDDISEIFSTLTIAQTTADTTVLTYEIATDTVSLSAIINVTLKDDGGTNNEGEDSYTQSFTISLDNTEITISANKDNPIARGDEVELYVDGGVSYEWQEGAGQILSGLTSSTFVVKPTQDYPYQVDVTTANGCVFTEEYDVVMDGDYNVVANNILSPNGDGYNDTWIIWRIEGYTESKVSVLDKSGRIIFSARGYDNSWDGTFNGALLPTGAYYYTVSLGKGLPTMSGTLTIVR